MERKNIKYLVISIVISLVAIVILLSGTFNVKSLEYLLRINLYFVGLALLLHILYFMFWAARIKVMSGSLNMKLKYLDSLKIVLVNIFAATVTPTNVGGEPVRIKMLMDKGFTGGDATGLVVSERVMDAIFLLSVAPLLFFIYSSYRNMVIIYFIYGSILILILLIILFLLLALRFNYFYRKMHKLEGVLKIFIKKEERRKKLINTLKEEYINFHYSVNNLFVKNRKRSIFVYFITAGMWISDFVIFSVILLAFGLNPIWIYSIFAQILIVFISMLPISPGGSGVVEFSAAIIYAVQIPAYMIGIVVLIWRLIVFYFNIAIGAVFTAHYFSTDPKKKKS
ncbi:MAG: lysylphosphatidylglycerol synthase transmembrane domain-containing protein [Thermoplasmata archaeon]